MNILTFNSINKKFYQVLLEQIVCTIHREFQINQVFHTIILKETKLHCFKGPTTQRLKIELI